jgi:collagenase-like PrtC family protease
MKTGIAVPVVSAADVAPLKNAGVSEMYFGYMSAGWARAFGDHDSVSRRQGKGNVTDENGFLSVLSESRKNALPATLTLNMKYTREHMPVLTEILTAFDENGGNAVMISDISLALYARERFPAIKIYLSLLAVAASVFAVRFYKDLGFDRIVFPRFMTYADMRAVSSEFEDTQFEAMAFFNKCRYVDGFCRYMHAVGRVHGCDAIRDEDAEDAVAAAFACGACDALKLVEAGVSVLKIGGRGFPGRCVIDAATVLRSVLDGNEPKESYKKAFGEDCGENCYRRGTRLHE